MYWVDKLSATEIGIKLNCSRATIGLYLRYFNIPRRTMSQSIQLAYDKGILNKKGSKSSNWKGGRSIVKRGYVAIYVAPSDPLHIMCRKVRNSVDEHRLVMARHFGRPLLSHELVHHINGNKGDNRIENLELRSASEHNQIERKCRGCPLKKQIHILQSRIKELERIIQSPLL